jgi:hypothetical protein
MKCELCKRKGGALLWVPRTMHRPPEAGLPGSIAAALGAALNLPHDECGAGREL